MLGAAGEARGRAADLVADSDARVLALSRDAYEKLRVEHPSAALLLITAALERSADEYDHHCTLVARTMFHSEPAPTRSRSE